MLDKKVIQFTRKGLVRKNLSTGESEVIAQSDFAKEAKYQPAGKEARYRSPYGHSDAKESSNLNSKSGAKVRRPANGERRFSASGLDNTAPGAAKSGEIPPPGAAKSEKTPSSGGWIAYPYGRHRGDINNARTAGEDGQRAQTPATSGKSTPKRSGAGKRYLFVPDGRTQGGDRQDDNPATQAVKTGVRLVRHRHEKIRKRVFRHFKNRLFQNGVKDEDNPAILAVGYGVRGTVYVGRGIRTAQRIRIKILSHPAVAKFLLLAAAIFIGLLLLCMLLGSLTGGLFGSTTEHPELTAYVQQLDDDFSSKITGLKKSYECDSHTDVKIQGSDVINTDPNVLAVLATGDWMDIDLTDENKAKLRDCYDILNAYTVSETKEKVKEISDTGEESTYTEHHVTITIITSSAQDKIDDFGFTDTQKKDILDMLNLLNQIDGAGIGDSANPGTGGIPGQAFDDPQIQALFTEANQYLGYPYVWGGSNPSTSFDCSGFVCWVFTHSGVHNLPRTTAQGLYDECTPVSQSEAKPGDLVFFTQTYPTSSTVTHVGIYAGNGRMLHCGDPIQYTTLDKAYWQEHFYSYGRLK